MSPTSYSMRGPFSRTWSAQMIRPFFKWMTSAWAQPGESAHTQALTKKMTGTRIEAHSRAQGVAAQVTKVVARTRRRRCLIAALLAAIIPAFGQDIAHPAPLPQPATGRVSHSAAENLFLQLGSAELDSSRVYRARELSIDRAAFHISFDDGTIAFTQDVAGCVTGAFFAGEGEILLDPARSGGTRLDDSANRSRHSGGTVQQCLFPFQR